MAAGLPNHQAIRQVKTTSGNSPATNGQYGEAAGQTFIDGIPTMLNASGFVATWDGTTITNGILGISPGAAHNLATNAKGAPTQPFGSVQGGAAFVYGSVPNQPAAVNIAPGTPLADGRLVIELALPDVWYEGQIDNSSTGTASTAVTLIKGIFGLTVDATGHWYVDLYKNAAATAVLVVKQLDPRDPLGTSFGRVWFTFLPTSSQLYT
jgi:hypothetical protein